MFCILIEVLHLFLDSNLIANVIPKQILFCLIELTCEDSFFVQIDIQIFGPIWNIVTGFL